MGELTFDYIVVGAGSAGCVVAEGLSAGGASVLVLEAGPPDNNMWIHVPAGVQKVLMNPQIMWRYFTEPEPGMNGRRIFWPRGKTLGGSSAVNGMAYVRGQPDDYNHWAQLGNTGWGWDDVLPLFKQTENYWGGDSALHGHEAGGVQVTSVRNRAPERSTIHKATKAFIEGAEAAGLPFNADFNGPVQEGVGWVDHTVTDKGRRHSTARAFLKRAMQRQNVTVWTHALAERIEFEGRKATGIVVRQNGRTRRAKVRCEIVLSAGVINSPQLLMLSGVGPAAHLKDQGIELVADSPQVGGNLQDHMYAHWVHEVRPGYSFNAETRGLRLLPHILRYYGMNDGLLTTGASSAYIFCKTLPTAGTPDTQVGFRAYSNEAMISGTPGDHDFPAWSASVAYLRPKSRGELRLQSTDPAKPPVIHANYLSHRDDMESLMAAMRLIGKIYEHPALKDILVRRLAPVETLDLADDAALEGYIRATATSMFHPTGTCIMGPREDAVVDPRLRVRGVEGLRVADASIMPAIVSGNTNGPSIMIGAKAAQMILEDANA